MNPDVLRPYEGRVTLVTGARGFIGRHVVQALQAAGANVVSVHRTQPRVGGYGTVVSDLSMRGYAESLVATYRPAIVFNLAGYGVDPAQRDERLATCINAELVSELAAACAAHGDVTWPGQQLVHAGSALEYGTAPGDLSEGTAPQPTTLYGITKLAGTIALQSAVAAGHLRGITARLFTVYGSGEAPHRLLPSLMATARTRTPLALTSGGQRRDFTWVGDVIEGMLRLGSTRVAPATVNLATGTLESVRGFVMRAAAVIGIPDSLLRFGEVATRGEEMAHDDVNIARLQRLLDWQPRCSIEDGVRATLAQMAAP